MTKQKIIDRYAQMEREGIRKATPEKMPIYIIAVDEFATLNATKGSECEMLVTYITSTGRACNVFMIIATQHALNQNLPTTIRANLQSRICLRCLSIQQSINIIGVENGVKLVGYGDAIIQLDGKPEQIRAQMPLYDDITVSELLNK